MIHWLTFMISEVQTALFSPFICYYYDLIIDIMRLFFNYFVQTTGNENLNFFH